MRSVQYMDAMKNGSGVVQMLGEPLEQIFPMSIS